MEIETSTYGCGDRFFDPHYRRLWSIIRELKIVDLVNVKSGTNYDLAILDFTQAFRNNPKNTFVYYIRGAAYLKKGEYDIAISDFTASIRLNPNKEITYFKRSEWR